MFNTTSNKMLSPKMQRAVRVNDAQILHLADRAQYDHTQVGYLHKRTADSNKWQLRWFVLYQNILFYYDNESSTRPSGVVLLEGSYCERLGLRNSDRQLAHCFTISYRRENQRQYELRAASEADCVHWIDAIRDASFNKVVLQREELEQRHLHLLQVVESERTAREQYAQTCEDLAAEVAKLRAELCALKREWGPGGRSAPTPSAHQQLDALELKKIKKVQSFFRGWLCRRRWKQIVEQYIKSPHAESMRKRNSLVFRMVEAEEEYVEQMEILVSCFLRPFKMAASSKKPPCSHEDVNSIFLNSETVLFLHQIFLKGLTSRMESWPTLVLGDLFDMLLPMLSIYQEYVRSHHYSLQVLTECKQGAQFAGLLSRLEAKPACQGRTLETFLTYPMHQVPRYIITLHELLAHTPHDHVERKSLQHARQQLEDLSRQMHDEVSETENLRKNLAVERMIIEGCDILLDVNQVFVRQGSLSQVCGGGGGGARGRRPQLQPRQAFLFSHHLILGTRAAGGRLHLLPDAGRVPLADAMLVEEPNNMDDDSSSVCSTSSTAENFQNKDFKILFDNKGTQLTVHLVATSVQEKAAWCSDIAQCMENAQWTEAGVGVGGGGPGGSDGASLSVPGGAGVRSDPRLFTDDVDIRFSRALNSCKVPQIRYATPSRLLERLTDLRFLSVDFLNTFLLTYRVFTDGETVLEALRRVFYAESGDPLVSSGPGAGLAARPSVVSTSGASDLPEGEVIAATCELRAPSPEASASRKASAASSVSGYGSEQSDRDCQSRSWRCSLKKFDEELREQKLSPGPSTPRSRRSSNAKTTEEDSSLLTIPKIMASSSSSETLKGPSPSSPSNLSSVTLVGSPADPEKHQKQPEYFKPPESHKLAEQYIPANVQTKQETQYKRELQYKQEAQYKEQCKSPEHHHKKEPEQYSPFKTPAEEYKRNDNYEQHELSKPRPMMKREPDLLPTTSQHFPIDSGSRRSSAEQTTSRRASSERRGEGSVSGCTSWWSAERRASIDRRASAASHRSSLSQHLLQTCRREASQPRAGVVITSFRQSHRRSSTSTAAAAFAIATSASSNPREPRRPPAAPRDSVTSTAATMRVLNVLRHWVSKHSADFWAEGRLRISVAGFLEDIVCSPNLLPAEHRAAAHLLRLLAREEERRPDLRALLSPPICPSKESIETLSALEIAEQMTFLDHQIFVSIRSEEFLGQAWMKADKAERAPHILAMTRHFNQLSTLVVSEILRKTTLSGRVAAIEKWAAVADISRCLHNFNGTLQICAAFTNTSVFRLKKTWEKVSKTSKQTIEKLQALVSSDGRFRALRDALHRCDPPCIPYLGLYLSDLSFIEEGTPNFTPEGLLNFSKMRMIAHVIREIRHFQQTPYKIEHIPKVCGYLLDPTLHLEEESQYSLSLELEPRTTRVPLPQNM